MVLPISGQSSPAGKSTTVINSFFSQTTLTHRALLLLVILIQLFFVLYITHNPHQSLKSPHAFQSRHLSPQSHPISLQTHPHSPEPVETHEKSSGPVETRPNSHRNSSGPVESSNATDGCENRRIYVYELPAMFNVELENDCESLDPWKSKCVANLNGGFGPQAVELAGIVPENLVQAWYWTDHYWGEVVYHNRMLGYRCRTLDPKSATAFYIPFYVGLSVGNHLWNNHTAKERDLLSEKLLEWVQGREWYRRSNGSDHFIMLGRLTWDFRRKPDAVDDWGTSFLHMPGMRNVIRLSVEKNPWDPLEIAVPYPTIFHPRNDADVAEWQGFVQSRNRTKLFSFVGGARKTIKNDFRSVLEAQCRGTRRCRHVDCSRENCLDGTTAIMSAFLNSEFCLQPRGDGYTRRSVFDCMMAGSIPVFFWKRTAYDQYEWFVPGEPESYSVYIDRSEVRNGTSIKKVLEGYSKEKVEMMRQKVVEYIPRFLYAKSNEGLENIKDAFDVALDGVLMKFKDHMVRGRLGNGN